MPEDEEYEIAEPHAGAMIESLRAFGYDLRTAIADLIDNSIFAAAKNVWIYFHWNGADSYISITDDGYGMSETELYEAMRPGSKSPVEDRELSDLGRFGLGMKTASFSQCRRLTVTSRKNKQNPAIRRWDLDHVTKVDRWELLKYVAPGSEQRIEYPDGLKNGTYVFGKPKTKGSRRQIALSPSLAILLREYKEKQELDRMLLGKPLSPTDLVFSHPDGRPLRPNSVSRAFENLARSLGFQGIRFHDLRHAHATLMLQQGIHPKIVSERLGHSSVAITLDIYSHVLPGLQEAAARRFEECLQPGLPETQATEVR